jgi:hypothetical protein
MRNLGPGRVAATILAGLATAALTLALAACGGDSPAAGAEAGTEASRLRTETEMTEAAPAGARPELQAAEASGRCAGQLDEVVTAMDELRSQLVSGLAYEQYVAAVKRILAAYEAMPVQRLTLACLHDAGTAAERGINRYVAAGNVWTDCVEVPTCEAASIEADLQGKWHQASEYLSRAQRGLGQRPAG